MSCRNCEQGGHPSFCNIGDHPYSLEGSNGLKNAVAYEFMGKVYERLVGIERLSSVVDSQIREQMQAECQKLASELNKLINSEVRFSLYDTLGVLKQKKP
jgi:hypothetical protein